MPDKTYIYQFPSVRIQTLAVLAQASPIKPYPPPPPLARGESKITLARETYPK